MSTKESRRVLTRNFSGLTITLGESINVPTNGLGLGAAGLGPGWSGHSRSASEPAAPVSFVSKLPPAVANVPHEDTRAYLHSKMVDKYLVGNTLGEGSFAKVKEGFHSLVGEKVSERGGGGGAGVVNGRGWYVVERLLCTVHDAVLLQISPWI